MMCLRLLSFSSKVLQNTINADFTAVRRWILSPSFVSPQINNISCEVHRKYSTFFTQIPARNLKEGVQGVSNAGKKKGRGKGTGRIKLADLNVGQMIGTGYSNVVWPGLNGPVLKGKSLVAIEQLPTNVERQQEMLQQRDRMSKVARLKLTPLERGYSGTKIAGRSIGPPDPIADYTFEGFDTIVLEFKSVGTMTGTLGRKRRFSAFVVTGNKNGVAGYGLGKALNPKSALRMAKNKAAQKLMCVPVFENHGVYHNMFAQYQRSKVFIHKRHEGYGLICHRVLKSICQILGLKNLHCKVEGSTKNVQSVTKAFFNALINQETHAELAERLGCHVVEMKKEEDYRPRVKASPAVVKKELIVDEVEDIEGDFERHYYGGRVERARFPIRWHYLNSPSYLKRKHQDHMRRNQPQARIFRMAGLV